MMKAQEELNQMLLNKIHKQEEDKRKEPEPVEGTASYKKRVEG